MSLENKVLDLKARPKIAIRFSPNKDCHASVEIYDRSGNLVRNLASDLEVKKGHNTIEWNATDNQSRPVADGVYYYVIDLKSDDQTFVYNPYRETHGKLIRHISSKYNREENRISFDLPQAAMARIRVGLKEGGPLLAVPLEWTPKEAGKHNVAWDGRDSSGLINISDHHQVRILLFAYSLADNSIIVEGSNTKYEVSPRTPFGPKPFAIDLPKDRYLHARHNPDDCHSPRLMVEFPKSEKNEQGKLVLSGVVPVKIMVDPRDLRFLEDSRYEIMLFVNTEFLYEDESGFLPFHFMWNTTLLSEGLHNLTINVLSYNDHIGVLTKQVNIDHIKL